MRKVERDSPGPAALTAQDKSKRTELDRARAHQASSDPKKGSFTYAVYKDDEVKQRLHDLFHGKCAYCETFYAVSAPVDVEHYRPKGAVSEADGHPGYWWLASVWSNLLPSCIDCNRKRKQLVPAQSTSLSQLFSDASRTGYRKVLSGKKDSFPLATNGVRAGAENADLAGENPLLLDPTRDGPDEHLRFLVDTGVGPALVVPRKNKGALSARGAMSIQVYGLNRLALVQERTKLLRRLEFLGDLVIELAWTLEQVEDTAVVPTLRNAGLQELPNRLRQMQVIILDELRKMAGPKEPYSMLVQEWMERFTERLTDP